MTKYKYKCDNDNCNNTFIDENPNECPKCKYDDFTILSEVSSNIKKYILSIFLILIFVFLIYKVWKDWSVPEITIESVIPDNADESTAVDNLTVNILTDEDLCKYILETNMDYNPDLRVSISPNTNFKNKLNWSKEECANSQYFYVKILSNSSESEVIKKLIPKLKCSNEDIEECEPPSNNEIMSSFNNYLSDIRDNKLQFSNLLKTCGYEIKVRYTISDLKNLTLKELHMEIRINTINDPLLNSLLKINSEVNKDEKIIILNIYK